MKNPAKFDRCVREVKRSKSARNAYAICTAAGTRNPIDSIDRLARDFHQRTPRAQRVSVPRTPRKLMVLGPLRAVEYEIREGFPLHTWHPKSRPLLATDGKRLFIIGGRFRVTQRGIVDLDAEGREIE